ncbi:MAG: N-6 DNA methylase [Planctomycetes bacterium]|nr:N-6 DNA methylase [Planctomycetota bacterium]
MPEFIKPNHKAIKEYYAVLEGLRDAGAKRETELRAAFQEMLGKLARQRGWVFMPERPITRDGRRIVPDGTMLDEGVAMGHWEAKDGADKLELEAQDKIKKGYPTDNIIFEDTHSAIHFQGGIQLKTKNLYDPAELCLLLNQFFAYEKPVQGSYKQALAKFRDDVPDIAEHLKHTLEKAHAENPAFKKAFGEFFEVCRSSLNPAITQATVDEMLVQHLLTERIFRKVFHQDDFTRRNVIANEVEKVIDTLKAQEFDRAKFLKSLDYFYRAIEAQAEDLEDYSEKQEVLNTVYERFFQGYSVKVADTHGIVYTPQAIVDFMCASVEEVLEKEFGTTLGGPEVNILDPCTGTGNFIVNLIRRIPTRDLERMYRKQLFANEIMLLPYYIAALNIEHAYWERSGRYEPFEGLCFVDTLDINREERADMFMSAGNAKRVQRQRKAPITVIIGNPPYNVGQKSENDQNKNRKYEVTDQKIRETYSADSRATNKNALSDMYVKFFRWAVDRLQGRDGIVCYVSNNSFVDQVAFDGMRRHMAKDFTRIYHVDLHGNVRHNPKLSGTTHNVFGIQVGVGITVAVRCKAHKKHEIAYHRVEENLTRWEKYRLLEEAKSASSVKWQMLTPDAKATWLVADGADEFAEFVPLASKQGDSTTTVFTVASPGVKTNRDDVVYDFDREKLVARVKQFIEAYNAEVDRYKRASNTRRLKKNVDDFVKYDDIKWSRDLKNDLMRGRAVKFTNDNVRDALYRPFTKQSVYFDRVLNEEIYSWLSILPEAATSNTHIWVKAGGDWPTFGLAARSLVDLLPQGGSQCFPFYVYDEDGSNRRENVTDWALKTFREAYGDAKISKWDIFHYVYGMLHHPGYRDKFKDCLKRELPRIPFAGLGTAGVSPARSGLRPQANRSKIPAQAGQRPEAAAGTAAVQFRAFVAAGEKLSKRHLDYEKLEPWPLKEIEHKGATPANMYVITGKMRLSKDKKSLKVNEYLTLEGIPERCFAYRLGNRSALEWVIDQYQLHTDKKSGITSDPNRPDDPEYIVRLVKQVVRVSMETLDIIDTLPESYGGPPPSKAIT